MAINNTPPRRPEVIRCKNCGEDYSTTYKRCPFCDERPAQGSYPPTRGGGGTGRRMADTPGGGASSGGGGRGPRRDVNPVQLAFLVGSLLVIIAAAVIIFRLVAPWFAKDPGDTSNPGASTSQSQPGGSSSIDPGASTSTPDVSTPDPVVSVNSVSLDQSDFTLKANESYPIKASVNPADSGATVVWTSDNESAVSVAQDGTVTNVNTDNSTVMVTVTATCGDKSATCTVRAKSGSTGTAGGSTGSSGSTGSTLAAGSAGVIANAGDGLNIRSGPGTTYSVQASTSNGSRVTIVETSGDWYKISYTDGNGKTAEGYVSKDYVTAAN